MNLRDSLKGTAKERANIKAQAVASLSLAGEHTVKGLRIKIHSINKIDGGVEVFAQAWKGKQLGFGADGSVDIERFRVFNPPLLVSDPEGDIVREFTYDGQTYTRKLREDPEEAIKQALAHTISLVGKESQIQKGKVGNTTSTFFSDAGGDGATEGSNGTYATARSTGTAVDASSGFGNVNNQFRNIDGKYYIHRTHIPFDTSAIPDTDVISAAVLSLFGVGKTDTLAVNPSFSIVDSTQASNTALLSTDHPNVGSTAYATIAYSALSASAYNDWTLDAPGRAQIVKTGFTKFACRNANEIASSAPATGGNNLEQFLCYLAERAGTTEDSKLVVTHAAPANVRLLLLLGVGT